MYYIAKNDSGIIVATNSTGKQDNMLIVYIVEWMESMKITIKYPLEYKSFLLYHYFSYATIFHPDLNMRSL